MNRIEIEYTNNPTHFSKNGKVKTSVLIVRTDIKGYTNRPLFKAYGKEADILYNLLQFIDWKKAEKGGFIRYGESKVLSTSMTEEQYKKFYELLYGSFDEYSTW